MIEIIHFIKFEELINENHFRFLGKSLSIGEDGMNPFGILPISECLAK